MTKRKGKGRGVRAQRRRRFVQKRLPIAHDVYNRAVTLLYGERDEINRALAYELGTNEHALPQMSTGRHIVHESASGFEADYICIVWGSRAYEIGTLMHEIVHFVGHALRRAGMPHTAESEEAYCYYAQWIADRCLRAMWGKWARSNNWLGRPR